MASPYHFAIDVPRGFWRFPADRIERRDWGDRIWLRSERANYLALVRGLVLVNRALPPQPPIYDSSIRYELEPARAELWQSAPIMHLRGKGHCVDLAAARLAQVANAVPVLVETGRALQGGRLFHVIVKHSDGSLEDPSRILGMRY